jgi:hypothetical protein
MSLKPCNITAPMSRPSNVVLFEELRYLAIGLALVEILLGWSQLAAGSDKIGGPRTIGFIAFYVSSFFIVLIWLAARERKNWARWVLLILFAVAIPAYFPRFDPSAGVTISKRILRFGQFASQAIALFLTFTGNARGWFVRTDRLAR